MDALLQSAWPLRVIALVLVIALPTYAYRARGTAYAAYAGVLLTLSLPGALWMHMRWLELTSDAARAPGNLLLTLAGIGAGLHLFALVRPRMRGRAWRWSVSIPGQVFIASGALASLWLLAMLPVRGVLLLAGADAALGSLRWLDLLPLAVCMASLLTSTRLRPETVRIRLASEGPTKLERAPTQRFRRPPPETRERPLRIAQITDPHLGPWQSTRRLRERVARLVERQPDLVLLTGDFLTMEGRGSPDALADALSPLRAAEGRCFASFGNHDHEAPDVVAAALERNGVTLLVDDARVVDTPAGEVQIIGADYVRHEREAHLAELLGRFPRRPGSARVLLLHDPSAFADAPADDVDLVLSGHTHGGQLGLVSLGLNWTVLSNTRWPDHGLFARGASRLYVHRGTGFYGFPMRVGVPGEHSVLEVFR